MKLNSSHLKKVNKAKLILTKACKKFKTGELAFAWTGHKDSTYLLFLLIEICKKNNIKYPEIFTIDEGDEYKEVAAFRKRLAKMWGFKNLTIRNKNILNRKKRQGEKIFVKNLNSQNRRELKILKFSDDWFPFISESFVCSHLMKTVPLKNYIQSKNIKAVITAIRKDENPARKNETYFSIRKDPDHTRIHPLLNLTEADIWTEIRSNNIPIVSLYKKGYRSIGASKATTKLSKKPAWEQLDSKKGERAGRSSEKERLMKKLRNLGYM